MSKFYKRIQKSLKKHLRGIVLVGINQNNVNSCVENFSTVFVIDYINPPPRGKNVIPLRDTTFLHEMPEIDIVFLNQGFDENTLQFLGPLTRRTSPYIMLHEDFIGNTAYYEFLARIKYEMLTIIDNYQVWKVIGR